MLNRSISSSDDVACHRGPPSPCPVITWWNLTTKLDLYGGINMGDDEVLTVRFYFNGGICSWWVTYAVLQRGFPGLGLWANLSLAGWRVEMIFFIIWRLGADLAVHDGTPHRQEDEINPFNIVHGLKWTFLKSRGEIEPWAIVEGRFWLFCLARTTTTVQ